VETGPNRDIPPLEIWQVPEPQSASVQQYCAQTWTVPAMSRGMQVKPGPQNGPVMLESSHAPHTLAVVGPG